jgi:hypothetical protein
MGDKTNGILLLFCSGLIYGLLFTDLGWVGTLLICSAAITIHSRGYILVKRDYDKKRLSRKF